MSELSTALDCLALALHWLDDIDGIPSSIPGRVFVVNAALLALRIRAEPTDSFGIDAELVDDERTLSALFKADVELGKLIELDELDQHVHLASSAAKRANANSNRSWLGCAAPMATCRRTRAPEAA